MVIPTSVKLAIKILLLLALASFTQGKPTSQKSLREQLDPYPDKPRIIFRADGTFKLTIFSDLHFGENPWDDWGPEQDRNSVVLLEKILADEKPDFAVINGDLVTGENTFQENVTRLIDQMVEPFNKAEIPFAVTHGNHDNQANITHSREIEHMKKASRFTYTRAAPSGVGGFGGEGNYWVPVYSHPGVSKPVLILWFFDSRGGRYPNPNGNTPVPDWVDSTVADWIKSEAAKMDEAWGPAGRRAAVAFVHIPPHAIQAVQSNVNPVKNPGQNADYLGQGSVQDSDNTGSDTPFWDSINANIQNLHAIISGHDHGNEWCAREPKKKVIFCFSKHSGYGGYDKPGWGHGVRNLFFHTPNPKAGVETWIRFQNGSTRARVILNDKYDPVD